MPATSFGKTAYRPQNQAEHDRQRQPYDNAFMESYFSRFKAELLQGSVFGKA